MSAENHIMYEQQSKTHGAFVSRVAGRCTVCKHLLLCSSAEKYQRSAFF